MKQKLKPKQNKNNYINWIRISSLLILLIVISVSITTQQIYCTPIQIDRNAYIIDYSYDATDNKFNLEIETETHLKITLSDATGIRTTGTDLIIINEETFLIEPGTQKISYKVTENRGEAALGITTPTKSLILIEKTGMLEEDPGWMEVRAAAIGGIITGIGVITLIATKKRQQESIKPDRIL
ncbi:hypothetical protein [Methanonatronarchaeum sp. AMET-Sl]|uniref:hypothetical protein n=1 Tax=Methanonatronarchaeum sp. AMET-Sl TaxID=3037654 RepID=UPI00244E068D|nr:hypothetical protein [Methanonatronarchaeum sp. AMET-Sl]WGI16950.1 hypothetical protein QEN48_05470 [Methanonatronarchaeum sp. AMET-Sl]